MSRDWSVRDDDGGGDGERPSGSDGSDPEQPGGDDEGSDPGRSGGDDEGNDPGQPGGDDEGLDPEQLDTLFTALADERRRTVLHYFLLADDDAASVGELAEHVVERSDAGEGPEQLSVEFHHSTLPKLQDAGLVEYDGRSGAVRYRGGPLTEECLRLANDATRS